MNRMNRMNLKQATCKFFRQRGDTPIIRRAGHKRKIPVFATEFIRLSDIVPEQWGDWFYEMLSETNKFTWGDNNRSMVTARDVADVADELFDSEVPHYAFREWLKKVNKLDQMYVDLEN